MQEFDFDLQSIQAARELARRGKVAANQIAHYSEEQIDRILRNMILICDRPETAAEGPIKLNLE